MYRLSVALILCLVSSSAVVRFDAQDAPPEPKPVDYLIVCADGLVDVAKEWAAWRTENGRVAAVQALEGIKKDAAPSLEEIKEAIRKHAGGDKPRDGFQCLLLGDCPNEKSEGYDRKTEIPWLLTPQLDSSPIKSRQVRVPTDNCYADLIDDADHKPDIAVGRVPARTPDQARMALKKVKAYETAPAGEWMRNLTFFAGEGRFGPIVDGLLEKLFMDFAEKSISQDYNLRMTYANISSSYAYAPSRFSKKVIEEANAGALVLCYMGHGSWDRLDNMYVVVDKKRLTYPILRGEDVKDFNIPDGKLPVMLIVACDTGYMDHEGECLAERVIFNEKAPVAVLASSRNSHPYANTLLQKAFMAEITERKRATIGEAMLLAKRELVEAKDPDRKELEAMAMMIMPSKAERDELNRSHISMYNLTGDPGLRLRHPEWTLGAKLNDRNGRLSVSVAISAQGKEAKDPLAMRLEVSARRTAITGELKPVKPEDLANPDAKAREAAEKTVAENHAVSNDKAIQGVKLVLGGMTDTRTSKGVVNEVWLMVQGKLAPGDYLAKVFLADEKGAACGFTSVEITVKEAPQKDAPPEGDKPEGK